MIETTVLDYLKTNGLKVYMEIPETKPDEFYILEKTGSSKTQHICETTFALQSYAGTMFRAAEMSDAAKSIVEQLITLSSITHVSGPRDYNYTDPTTKQYRYQMVFTIIHY